MATACHGLVTRTCSIAPERLPWRWISFTLRRRVNQEKTLFIATNNPFASPARQSFHAIDGLPCPSTAPLYLRLRINFLNRHAKVQPAVVAAVNREKGGW
jgi:hypothetical protein